MPRQLKSGKGWRLGWDPDAGDFCGLLGGEDWAIEVTATELDDFCRLVVQLATTMQQIAQELMDEEQICCEVESPLLWLEAQGYPHAYSLHLIVLTGRRGEGTWGEAAVPALVQAAQVLKVF
jgi:hypothetical protein